MNLIPHETRIRFSTLIQRAIFHAERQRWRALANQVASLVLVYTLLLQTVPISAIAHSSQKSNSSKAPKAATKSMLALDKPSAAATLRTSLTSPLLLGGSSSTPGTTDAVITRHRPTFITGSIDGSLRVLLGESFTINGSSQLIPDVFLPGSPSVVLNVGAQHEGIVNAGGSVTPTNYTLTLSDGVSLGKIHTRVDAVELPTDFPASVPAATGTRTVTVQSQAAVANIGNWTTVRDLNVNGSNITVDVPPGNYRTFTVNGNSKLKFSAGTYNFANTLTLDGSATLQTTSVVTINVGGSLTINSGALALGSYTSPGDVRLNVLGSVVNINGSSQVSGLLRAYNATVTLNGSSQVRGQVIADSFVLNGGKAIGAVWPAVSGSCPTIFGPRRFDRTTGPPNQYVEQFSVPADVISPITLHIQNGAADGTDRVSSATVKLNGVDLVTPSDLNQNVAGLDRTITLTANNQLDVKVESAPGSYLIIGICGTVPVSDTTDPTVAITSPANGSTTTTDQTTVSGSAADTGAGASGIAHVYVNNLEAAYSSATQTWTIDNVHLDLGPNQITARAVDQASNDATASISITRESPVNETPTANAGTEQTIKLPQTASLQGTATDDGLPDGSTLTVSWSKVSGPGTVTFSNGTALQTSATFSVAGTYVLRLTATDGDLSHSSDVTIIVQPENQPPTVTTGSDQTIALPHTATLNGTVTDDGWPYGGTVTTLWSKVSGPGDVVFEDASLHETAASFSEPGTYVLRLTASDTELSSVAEMTITVQPQNQAPQANASTDQTISLPNGAQLNGSVSDDSWPAGSSLTTLWTMVSGPTAVSFDNANTTVTVARFTTPGEYVLRLTVSDGELSDQDDVKITVTPPNAAPLVVAGDDQIFSLPQDTTTLNGSVIDDGLPLGATLAISWSKISGPGTVVFGSGSNPTTTAQFSEAGSYVLRLTATDGEYTSFDDVLIQITPANQAPTANAGADQTIALPSLANLNGSTSDDGLPLNSTVTTSWSKVSGPGDVTFANPSMTVTTASFSAAGTYALRLTAGDSQLSSSDEVTITVEPQNQAPSVNAGADQTIALPSNATFDGTVTDDGYPTGSSVSVTWSQVSGPGTVMFGNANSVDTTASFSVAGSYVLRLTASDSRLSSSDEVTITVEPQNQAPSVNAGADQTIALPSNATLDGTVTDDAYPTGSSVSVTWSKVSGPGTVTFGNSQAVDTTASFIVAGTYVLRLTASDSQLSSSDEVTITVEPQNQSPSVNAGADQSITLPNSASLNGSTSDDGYPSSSTVTVTWSKFSGPGNVTFASPNTTITSASFSTSGTYVLRLTASDGQLSTSDDVTVTVVPQNFPPTVNAGADQSVSLPNVASLNGSVTDDGLPAGSTLVTQWSQVSGPGTTVFANAAAAITTASFNLPGTYVLRLTSNDSQLSAFDELTVTVTDPRVPPVADFVVPESSGAAGSLVLAQTGSQAVNLLDDNIATAWSSSSITNQLVTLQFYDQESVFIDRVRLQAINGIAGTTCVRDFDVRVSSTTSADASFVTVLSATLLNNGQLQEFLLPAGPARARYIRLVPKNNYGSASSIQLATFNAVAAGGADSIISLPGQSNVSLAQSPSLIANGAALYTSTYAGGELNTTGLNPQGILGYNNGGWNPFLAANPYAVIQLAEGKLYSVKGVKVASMSGVFSSTIASAVRNFEVWVSSTTPDDAAFTKVLTGTKTVDTTLQTFFFPSGPVQARYVKYVPLTSGGATTVNTQDFDVIAEGVATVVGSTAQNQDSFTPPDAAFDADPNSFWYTPSGATSNVWVKTSLANEATQKIYGVRITPVNNFSVGQRGPKDFDIRVSTTTSDDSAFTTVYSGTLAGTFNGGVQEFLFANSVDAKYVQFFWKNGYSPGVNIGVSSLEVLSNPTRGSAIVGFSTQEDPASNALDLDPSNQWVTALNNPTNQWLKLVLPGAAIQTIRHIALRPAIATNGNYSAPKDFELQVSTTDSADASFTTVLAATLANSTQLQDFYFSPVSARYVRLLLKNNYGNGRFGLANFYVYSPDQIGSTTRFIDRSADADGQIVSWAWNFGDGGTSAEQHATHTFPAPGDYTVSLTVADNSGLTHSRQSVYHVLESLRADFAYSPIFPHEGGEQVRFLDTSGLLTQATTRRRYVFGDGATLAQASTPNFHKFNESGGYQVTLNVGDPLGVNYQVTKDVVVLNVSPTVDIPNGKTVVWGELWTSVPTLSDQSVADGLTLQGQWNFGDGQTSQCVNCTNANATVTHAYSAPGTYTAVLSITDRDGGAGSDSATYVVNKRATSVAFQANSLQASGQTFLSRVKLTDSFANIGIPNRPIQFNLNGTTGSATTDANGVAEITLPISPGTNVVTATATWAGDTFYLPSSNTANTTLNFAPTVNAGADQAITQPCIVSLSGTVTDDGVPNGVPLSVSWSKVSGPGSVSFANANAPLTTASFSASGKYVLRLTAGDTQLSSIDDITITVNLVEVGTTQYFGPTPYLSFADSPLGGRGASYFHLENFEDHLLNTPGVSASAGGVSSIAFGSFLHDSVDGDDGVIDGNGTAGDAYFSGSGTTGITFTFNAGVLGNLPTHAGLVWTDGAGQVFFEAFDRNGVSMGVRGPYTFPDGSNNGTTAEDNFLGAYNKDGISAIKIRNTVGGIEIDHLQYAFSTANGAPIVNAGPDQTVELPVTTLSLNGTVFDDGLPACTTVSSVWNVVSGPGAVSFTNSQAATTSATLSVTGTYVLRLTANDSQFTSSDDLVISFNQAAINSPPMVNAGSDQAITLPVNSVNLNAVVTDDGRPAGSTTAVVWSVLSGPASVTFANSQAAATTATFSAAGTYVLRITASDSQLTSSDDLVVTVNPELPNQPPTANAGPDQNATINGNLVANSGNEAVLLNDEIPGWFEVQGTSWTQSTTSSGAGFPTAQRGAAYFFAGSAAQAELRQDVDVSAFAGNIAAGTQQFQLQAYLRSLPEGVPDAGRVILEYRNATNTSLIASLDSGPITSTTDWHLTEDTRAVPPGTGWIRVRLLATRNSGTTNDAFFDSVSLRSIGNTAVKLDGSANDDGLPSGSSLSTTWATVSGPAQVVFANPNAVLTGASFSVPGTYLLRLTSSDGQANTSDDVTVIVNPVNQSPVVNAGGSQAITLPATANLSGTVTDDGQPPGSSVSIQWTKASGPGSVTFGNANGAITSANFSVAGTYVLRLTADDSEYSTSADVTITVNPEPAQVNQPPTVNPGPNQTISLPTDTVTLNGVVTDDGLPAGSTLIINWTKVSGSGNVTFGSPNSAVTTAQFSAVGSYVLRLSASDGGYLVSADVGVILTPANQAPTANAGADQTSLLSQPAQLDGSASDDGLPNGNVTTTWSKVSGPGTVTFINPNHTITGATFSAIGEYVLRLTASDGALTGSDDVTITVIDDVAPPTVEITAPLDGDSVTKPTLVTGSVSGGAWVLEYSLASDDNTNNRIWTTFASGNGATSGQLGTLDSTMMLNGLFDIRLSATDTYGQTSRTTLAVVVERNLKIGNFTVSFSDLNIPVAGVPMEVTRTYDTRDKRVGDFGFGWTMGLKNIRVEKSGVIGLKWYETASGGVPQNFCLQPLGSNIVSVTFPGGKVFKFKTTTTPQCKNFVELTEGTISFTPMPGTHGTLEVVGSADFHIDAPVPGPVNLLGFAGGVDIFNSFVFKFTAEDGTAYVIDQRTGLQSIADLNGNTVTIGAGGIVHSNGKSITFTRDGLGRITSVTDPNGNSQTYTYDTNGDLVSYTDNENNTSTYTYDANHRLLTIHDPRGIQPIRNDYDADGRLISHTDGFGKVITYIHDLPARMETITDRLGHPTVFEYDERGNVLRKTDARGGVTSFTYDANDNVLTETNALSKTTIYTYDANDHRTSITDPLGNVTQFTYNALGKVLTTTDPLNHVTTNTYNGAGNLLTTKDALNNTTSFGYGIFDGQRTSMTDALNRTTSYTYTSGYLTKETDALDHETTFTYDSNGNRASQTVKRTNAQGQLETLTTSFEYDKLNRLKKTTFADASFTQVEYNSIGQQSATIDQLGHRTEFTYDDMGRLTRTDYPDGTHDETTYDAEGRRLTSTDRAGHVTSFIYDELGRLTKTTFADNTFTSTTYDAVGQVLTTTDGRGNVTHFEYDNAGRRTKVRNALNQETTFAYDAGGNQLSMTDALSHTTTYEYDLNNRRTKTIYADSSFDTVGYDALDRSESKTDQAGKTTQFTYDSLGRLTKVKDALNQETSYAYNEIGQQVSQTDANNHTTRFEYDQLGRRVKRILPGGQFETYAYSNGGNLESKTDFNGHTTTFNYDVMRRLLSKVPDTSLNQPTVSFTYNPVGQRATMSDASGATVYNYDVRNRLSSKQMPFGTLSYTYNEAGSLFTTRSSNANGVSVDYSYDSLNRLATVKDNNLIALNGGLTNYSYDDVGNLEGYSYPNSVNSSYAYNSLNRLTTMTVSTSGSWLASYSYTLGPAGNRTAVTELGGCTVNYTYDDLYRLTSEAITNDPHGVNGSVSYGYDAVGNRLNRSSSITPVASQTSTYDVNDRLTSDSYDNNGNTTTASGNSYTYDFENHLTSLNGGNVTYLYDGDGNRVAKTVGGVTINYLVDTNNPTGYAQVVDELRSGAVVKSYTYGHDLISQRIVGGSLNFYQYDGHGSVRLLTDATAAVTDTYNYDAFGNLIYRSGATPNDYLYSGEQFDANLGFYYLRARYMDPTNGRFINSDSYEGRRFDPATLHKYLYANADPVNRVDPSGQVSVTEALVAVGAVITAASLIGALLYFKYRTVPTVVSWEWRNEWTDMEGKGLLSESEIAVVKYMALETFKKAFKGFLVISYEGGGSDRKMYVQPWFGESGRTFGTVSNIYYEGLRHSMLNILSNAGITKTRAELVEGFGRGIGATAAHELGHQTGLWFATDTTRGADYYDAHEVGLDSYNHFFGDKQWSPTALEQMRRVLSPAPE